MEMRKSIRLLFVALLSLALLITFMPQAAFTYAASTSKVTKVTNATPAKSTCTMTGGKSKTFKVKLSPKYLKSAKKTVTFKSSNTKIATVGKVKYVKKSGYYYAYAKVKAVKGGKATITAKAKYGSKQASWKLTVKNSAVTYSMSPSGTLYVGAADDHYVSLDLKSMQNGVSQDVDISKIQSVTVAKSGITAKKGDSGTYVLDNSAAMTTKGGKTTKVIAVIKVGSGTKTLTCNLKYSDAAPVATTSKWEYFGENGWENASSDKATFSISDIYGIDDNGEYFLDPSKTKAGYEFADFNYSYWLAINDQYKFSMKDATAYISNRSSAYNIKAMVYDGHAYLYFSEGTTPTAGTFDLTIKSGSISKTIHVTATGSAPEHSVASKVIRFDGTNYYGIYNNQSLQLNLAKNNITTAAQLVDFVNTKGEMIITDAYDSIVDPTGMATIEYTPKSGTAKALDSNVVVTSDKHLHVTAGDGTPAAGDVIKATFKLSSTNVCVLTVTLQ